jgi:hypothetical protein
VTLNVEPGPDAGRLSELRKEVGDDLIPEWVTSDADLGGSAMSKAIYEIISAFIANTLVQRNGSLEDKVRYKQLFHFRYADGARMLSVGGLLHAVSVADEVAQCNLELLPHVVMDAEPFNIDVPNLTVRETLHLDAQLPAGTPLAGEGVPEKELRAYERLYRFLPSFIDADL